MFRYRHMPVPFALLVGATQLSGCLDRSGGEDSTSGVNEAPQSTLAMNAPEAHGGGLPFGPFHLPDSLLGQPYSSTIRGARTGDEALATLDAARRAKARIILRLARGSSRFSNPDSSFSLARWKKEVDRYRGIDLGSYVADGTLLGHLLFDEPHDPTNWNGTPVSYSDLEAAASYSKQLWPTLPTGIGSPPTALRTLRGNAPRGALDFALAQHRPKKGEVHAWRDQEVAMAKQLGYGLMLSLQALEGNSGQPLTAEQLRTFGSVLAADPYACMLAMWKWDKDDPRYFKRADIRKAVNAIAVVARSNQARSCDPRAGAPGTTRGAALATAASQPD